MKVVTLLKLAPVLSLMISSIRIHRTGFTVLPGRNRLNKVLRKVIWRPICLRGTHSELKRLQRSLKKSYKERRARRLVERADERV